MEGPSYKKRVRDQSDESELASPEVKRLRENILHILDDSDLCTTSQDLDSFMKSFAEEISGSSPASKVVDSASVSGESQPVLGHLLEATDDELGLPPSTSSVERQVETDLVRVTSDSSEISELWRLDEQISAYDSLDFGFGDAVCKNDNNNNNSSYEYVALDGLFD